MANALGIDFAADLATAIGDLPTDVTISGRVYQMTVDDERRALEIEEPGRYATYDRVATCALSTFRTIPALQTMATIDGQKYFIADIVRNRETDTLQFTLRREDGK